MHHSTSVILEDVTNHYNNLVDQHKKIHQEIEHNQYYAPDALLTNLKKKKLKIKDEIEVLRNNLQIISRQ